MKTLALNFQPLFAKSLHKKSYVFIFASCMLTIQPVHSSWFKKHQTATIVGGVITAICGGIATFF